MKTNLFTIPLRFLPRNPGNTAPRRILAECVPEASPRGRDRNRFKSGPDRQRFLNADCRY
jgi:hypothetical protein